MLKCVKETASSSRTNIANGNRSAMMMSRPALVGFHWTTSYTCVMLMLISMLSSMLLLWRYNQRPTDLLPVRHDDHTNIQHEQRMRDGKYRPPHGSNAREIWRGRLRACHRV